MDLFNIMTVSGSALDAQSVRLNTISSNLANANSVSGTPDGVYRPRYPVFRTILDGIDGQTAGVAVTDIVESSLPGRQEYAPSHPLADEQGYIYRAQVNSVDEMANMIEASRAYQSSVEVMNTTKQLILRTLSLGR